MSRRATALGGASIAVAAAIAWLAFSPVGAEPPEPPALGAPEAIHPPATPEPVAVGAIESDARAAQVGAPRPVLPQDPTPMQLVEYCDATDLHLLSDLEAVGQGQPAEALELIRRAQRGDSEEALRAYIDESMSRPVLRRAVAVRWWRARTGRPAATPRVPIARRPSTGDQFIVQRMAATD